MTFLNCNKHLSVHWLVITIMLFYVHFVFNLLLFGCVKCDIKLQCTVAINCKPFIMFLLGQAVYFKTFKLPWKKNLCKIIEMICWNKSRDFSFHVSDWRLLSCGMWHHVVWYEMTYVSVKYAVYTLSTEEYVLFHPVRLKCRPISISLHSFTSVKILYLW
jgi:hypothetical protein